MLAVGDSFENTRLGGRFEVLATPDTGGPLELRLSLTPGRGKSIAHRHADFVERFVVEAGVATARLVEERLALGSGQTLEIRAGIPHVNPYNAGGDLLVMRQSVEPATRFTLALFETHFSVGSHAPGASTVTASCRCSPRSLWLMRRPRKHMRSASPAGFKSRPFPCGAYLARRRGY